MEKHIKGSKKHITSDHRYKILKYLSLGFNLPKIAKILGFNKTSIYKEIILNSIVENKKTLIENHGFKNCKNILSCKAKGISKCPKVCFKYLAKTCPLIAKPFQVCNFCERKAECRNYEHLIYHPEIAHDNAKDRFRSNKSKIKLSSSQLENFDKYVSKLVINGQSPEAIKSYSNFVEFPVCSKTLRNYIDKGLMTAKPIDLRRKLSIRPSKDYSYQRNYSHDPLKKIDHLYGDYLHFMENHPNLTTFQCDTVLGKRQDKKCLLTIHADLLHFQMYILLTNKTPCKVLEAFNSIKRNLGEERFSEVFSVLLSDNGGEFDDLTSLEVNKEGMVITHVFYTRAYRSSDKAECERNHELFRYIRQKGKTLETLDEKDLQIINSNINSYPRKSLKWKTPIEAMKEMFGEDIIDLLGIIEIKRKDVNLTASLLSHPKK